MHQIGVRIVLFKGTTAEDRYSYLAGSLQRPKPKPLPVKQENGIHILTLQQLRRTSGSGAGHSPGFARSSLLHLIPNHADRKSVTQHAERGLVALAPATTKTDDAQT